jgi:hypothetical protein
VYPQLILVLSATETATSERCRLRRNEPSVRQASRCSSVPSPGNLLLLSTVVNYCKAASIKVLSTDLDAVIETKSVVSTVAVAGATGRTGRLVVQKLLDRGVPKVVAIVRDTARAKELLPYPPPENLEIVTCDLSQPSQITQVPNRVDAVIWCATGISDAKADRSQAVH